jgi:Fic family protein
MINQATKNKIFELHKLYKEISAGKENALLEIAIAEIPEMVYNSNAIENSTLTLEDTENILLENQISKKHNIREVYEAKNLAKITQELLQNPTKNLSSSLILNLHKNLLWEINNDFAGRFRRSNEWVRVGNHLGANPLFVANLVNEIIEKYNNDKEMYFLDKIAWFHAEFETIHPFCDGNGRMGRILINKQLIKLNFPPIIIQNKNKHKDYYPLFTNYPITMDYSGFTSLFALLLQESMNKRISYLSSKRIIPLSLWAKQNKISGTIAANKAKRQSIPAFRLRGRWVIAEDFSEKK